MIVLTTFDADDHVVGALGAGADGFLLKDTPPPQILEAIRAVADGDPMLSPSVTRTLIERIRDDSGDDRGEVARLRLGVLTEREHEVALAVGRGLTNAEIARTLHLSVPTVKAHVVAAVRQAAGDQPGADRDLRPRRRVGLGHVVRRALVCQLRGPGPNLLGGGEHVARVVPRRHVGDDQPPDVRGLRDLAAVGAGEVDPGRVVSLVVERRLGEQQVGAGGKLHELVAQPGVAGEGDQAAARTDPQAVGLNRVLDLAPR